MKLHISISSLVASALALVLIGIRGVRAMQIEMDLEEELAREFGGNPGKRVVGRAEVGNLMVGLFSFCFWFWGLRV
jgi:hypothetical protein